MVTSKVSLIITTYNSEYFLPACFSMLKQAACHLHEVIFVDDCSTDSTSTIIESFIVSQEERIYRSHRLETNTGRPAEPRNFGKALATGDWVVFCDVDDLIPTSYFKFLAEETSKHVISLTKVPINNQSQYDAIQSVDFDPRYKIHSGHLKYKNMIALSGAAVPRDLVGLADFPNEVLEDWKYWSALAARGATFIKLTRAPVYYWSPTTLSPAKPKQVNRVAAHIGWLRIVPYFLYTLKLRHMESLLERSIKSNSQAVG